MSMLKICIATSYTQDFAELGNICATTLKFYAKKYGYTLSLVPNLVMLDRSASWHRIKYTAALFDLGFDFVFWMDADALFLRYDRDIQEVIEPGKDLYLVRLPLPDGLRPSVSSSDQSLPNTSVMLLRNCEWTRGFLEEIWNREQYQDHPWQENGAVIDLLGYFSLLGKGEDRPNKDLLDHVKFIDLEWNSIPHLCSASHPIVHHYAGLPRPIRKEKITEGFLLSVDALAEELDALFRRIGMRYGFVVQQGPFAGMVYLSQQMGPNFGSVKVSKLLGAYEAELHDVITCAATPPYTTVVNIGCAEGYYAVGLARLLPHAHIYAFDIDQPSQEWCAELARLNDVSDRVTVAGVCTVEHLRVLTSQPALLVVDCEGCELDLLQPDVLPGLRQCDMLVELHDIFNPIISHTIRERFASTHTVTIIDGKERDPADYAALRTFSTPEQRLAVEEFRPCPMQWAFMTKRHDNIE
jgi:hypothetical protein